MQDAKNQCSGFGEEWDIAKETDGSIVCTKNHVSWDSHCDSCDTWRLVVFKSGSDEYGTGTMSTRAGVYYGGHSPCTSGSNFQFCAVWPLGIPRVITHLDNRIAEILSWALFVTFTILFLLEIDISGTCDGTFDTGKINSIISPNYPRQYGKDVQCTWSVTSPVGTSILLQFSDFTIWDENDSLSVYEGASANGRLIKRVSGFGSCKWNSWSKCVENIWSSENDIHLVFTSDQVKYSTDKGFRIVLKPMGNYALLCVQIIY